MLSEQATFPKTLSAEYHQQIPRSKVSIERAKLVHCRVGLRQREGRDFNIKLLFTLVDHLVGAVH